MTRRSFTALLPLALLAACAGYASDYWRSEVGIIQPQLVRYGFDESQAQCAGRRLAGTLSVWQLRQLERTARLMPQQRFGRSALAPIDLVEVAAFVEDRRVAPEVAAAIQGCGVSAPETVAAAEAAAAAAAAPAAPVPGGAAGPLWLNLGAAPTGQAISVNAASLVEEGSTRQAWFRLTDPGASGPSAGSYLLRVDCNARTINAMATRRHGPDGAVVSEHDFGPSGEGAAPVAGGTVMEIAYLALCT
jgi:hypothetical protein